jgi:small subunit ribosomal protein S4
MARYLGPREKISRRLGENLFLKGERSRTQKSAAVRRAYPPGVHGHTPSRKTSEYGMQLRAKQRVRNVYRMLEKQFKNNIQAILETRHEPYEAIVRMLELRLDNIVFRMGLAQSRDQARQLVNHGHITLNGKKVGIPSCVTKQGDTIGIREASKASPYFANLVPQWLQGYETPEWLEVDKEKMIAIIRRLPTMLDSGIRPDDLQAIIEFYSR